MARPLGKPRCPCCGHVALTDGEERLLAALGTAPSRGVTAAAIQNMSRVSPRMVTRGLGYFVHLGLATWIDRQAHGEKLWMPTAAGKRACAMLSGRVAAE